MEPHTCLVKLMIIHPYRQHIVICPLSQLEKIQRSFTKYITGMHYLPYHERLKSLRLYSLLRRREMYCIIYIWKIVEDLVPNFSSPITSTFSERRCRSCVIFHVNVCSVGTLAYNHFRWRLIGQCTYVQCPCVQLLNWIQTDVAEQT